MLIYAIIVTYNSEAFIERLIKNLLEQTIKIKIVIIDNASSDKTVEILNKYKDLIIIKNKKNLGFGRANNIGFKLALKNNADYVVIINQDVEIQDNEAIEKLISIHKKHPNIGLLSPLQLNKENKPAGLIYYWFLRSNRTFFDDALACQLKELYEVPFVSASLWLYPIKTLKIVGGFNPMFFMYGEDTQYCFRVLRHNFKIVIASNVFYKHYKINFYKKNFKRQILETRNFIIEQITNPDYSFFNSMKNAIRRECNNMILYVFNFNLKLALSNLLGIIWFFMSLRKIYKNYINEIKKQPTFLDYH
jgi:GT2 family glycosyltransferase